MFSCSFLGIGGIGRLAKFCGSLSICLRFGCVALHHFTCRHGTLASSTALLSGRPAPKLSRKILVLFIKHLLSISDLLSPLFWSNDLDELSPLSPCESSVLQRYSNCIKARQLKSDLNRRSATSNKKLLVPSSKARSS